MFKKPLGGTKTSAPLRASDRRKLKQHVIDAFPVITPDDADILVPDGIQTLKFSTYLDHPGLMYLAPNSDPLWFTIGNIDNDLIPTIYTLWKRPNLLPTVTTPSSVIPVLAGGADLMIPGVTGHPLNLHVNQLVAVIQREDDALVPSSLSPPLAVGRMAVPSEHLGDRRRKGKAVHILHTWKDHLWNMGSKPSELDPIPSVDFVLPSETQEHSSPRTATIEDAQPSLDFTTETITEISLTDPGSSTPPTAYTAQDISALLTTSLHQAIRSSVPASTFPMPATLFYTNHILPARPAFPVLPSSPDTSSSLDPTDITIKSSTHKSLTVFLKAAEKTGVIALKAPPRHAKQNELLVTSVDPKHPEVVSHVMHVCVRDVEEKKAKKAEREEKARDREESKRHEVRVLDLWKPHLSTLAVFEAMNGSTAKLYSPSEVRALLNDYITANALQDLRDQALVGIDDILAMCVAKPAKASGRKGGKTEMPTEAPSRMRREELTKALLDRMQPWHEVHVEGRDVVRRKGAITPIQVTTKMRQGRKVCTLVTGHESFLVVDAEDMAEELRKACASATSVSPVQGKGINASEVLVQGKQIKPIVEYLTGKGVHKKWIEVHDKTGKK